MGQALIVKDHVGAAGEGVPNGKDADGIVAPKIAGFRLGGSADWDLGGEGIGLNGAEGQGQSGGAVGVAVGSGKGAVEDLAGVRDGAIDRMKIFPDVAAGGDEQFTGFQSVPEAREQFGFEGGGEGAEFEPAGRAGVVSDLVAERAAGTGSTAAGIAEFGEEAIPKANARAGVVDAKALAALEAGQEELDLLGRGQVLEGENLARETDPAERRE